MKIILSRKGFDSGYGGYPSPILPDGTLLSLPIPDFKKDITYNDLHVNDQLKYIDIMRDIIGDEIKFENNGKVRLEAIGCHFDPDIRKTTMSRTKRWKGLFGQAGAARSHLKNSNVIKGDIFLFFGWFREVELIEGRYRYSPQDKIGRHIIYGYLEIGEEYQINKMIAEDWMQYHPHVIRGKEAKDNDVLYVASDRLSFDDRYMGYGSFVLSDKVVLTKDGFSRSRWDLPNCFKKALISYHSHKSWKEDYFQSAAKGQEFVVEATSEIQDWLKELIKVSANLNEINNLGERGI